MSLGEDESVSVGAAGSVCPFIGIYYLSSDLLQASGNAAGASIASALRQGIPLIPLLFIMNSFMGMFGLATAHRTADFFAILITPGMALHYYRITGKFQKSN